MDMLNTKFKPFEKMNSNDPGPPASLAVSFTIALASTSITVVAAIAWPGFTGGALGLACVISIALWVGALFDAAGLRRSLPLRPRADLYVASRPSNEPPAPPSRPRSGEETLQHDKAA
jgi:hypothetical protein